MDFIFGDVPRRLVPFDDVTFEASLTRFVTVCTDAETGRAVYYDKEGEDLLTLLRASASMPFLSPLVPYRGRLLLDGALGDSVPWHRAVAEGYRRNVVVLTRPAGYRKKKPHPLEAINHRWEQYNASLDAVEAAESRGEAVVFRPEAWLRIGRTEGSVAKLNQLYEMGRQHALAAVDAGKLA